MWSAQEACVEQTPPAEAQSFVFHERPDGTAAYALDVIDAIKLGCTGLAEMEPGQANALFRLAARPVEAPAEKTQAVPKIDKPKAEKEKPQPPQPVKDSIEPKVVEEQHTVTPLVIEQRRAQTHAPTYEEVEKAACAPTVLEVVRSPLTKKPQPKMVPTKRVAALVRHKQPPLAMPQEAVPLSPRPLAVVENHAAEDESAAPSLLESQAEQPKPVMGSDASLHEIGMFEQLEMGSEVVVGEPYVFADEEVLAEATVVRDFKALVISERSATVAPLPIETIQAQANEQPLEQTLVQLACVLEVGKTVESSELVVLLRNIAKAHLVAYVEKEEMGTGLTPEVTDKLLLLLGQIGYEQPAEALKAFVRLHGSATLLQIIAYLYQLSGGDTTGEWVGATTIGAAWRDDIARVRVGKLLFGVIAQFTAPALAA